jgi:hypothetical protein
MSEEVKNNALAEQMKALGVSLEEMDKIVNPDPENVAAATGGASLAEGKGGEAQPPAPPTTPTTPEVAPQTPESLVPLTDESLDEAFKFMKKKIGAKVRKKARKAKKYYRKMKAHLKKIAKKWKKSAAGKRFLKKYKKAKERLGGMLKQQQGKKRLQISGLELAAKLQEQVGSVPPSPESTDIEILENGAVIAAMLGDRFEDLELENDAAAARQTSDTLISVLERHEGKGTVSDEEIVRAVKAVGLCIDHFEKLEAGALPLPA